MTTLGADLQIGSVRLDGNLILAPLAGYTNLPFRLVIRELGREKFGGFGGVGLCVTDLVNARSLVERNPKALQLIASRPEDRPLSVQLFGSVPEEMVEAAKFVEQQGAALIDINMGCPVRKVCKVGGGSAMMTETARTAALVAGMVKAVGVPVTCKMRLGWDDANLTAPELARALEEAGAAAIMIHGRTRAQGFDGTVNLPGIRAVVEAVKSIPVIGNGDVTTPQAARAMLEETGCAGVSIGRGAFYDPWLFSRIRAYLATGTIPPEASFGERVRVMTRHLDLMVEVFGEAHGCRLFRKVAPWYTKRFGPSAFFNKRVVRLNDRAEYDAILGEYLAWRAPFLDADGVTLQAKFAPPPMAENFSRIPLGSDAADNPEAANRTAIPVPSGPQEWW
ncbi:tRNA-U20-dihydrouridine synthase [Verrucomicrobium sp. GAS474]|uniref:tRNA dihydrouridine synthase DusB n=1 Tax=Verrucomicrobium sp. GAS474 TaxID=1882831 RepID=UPI00087B8777|nr:tRNA dihydrouridine synthase DusB [Verrucomicrobium sp. GAS474]SDT93460.1 tRNA-U20-dihydrouridine synthase [Verrucomicrobium sp. GAS474]